MSEDRKEASASAAPSASSSVDPASSSPSPAAGTGSALGSGASMPSSSAPAQGVEKKPSKSFADKSKGISEWAKALKKNLDESSRKRLAKEAEEHKNDPNPIRAQMARFESLMTEFMIIRNEKFEELFSKWEYSCATPEETTGQRARREMLAMEAITKQIADNETEIQETQEILSIMNTEEQNIKGKLATATATASDENIATKPQEDIKLLQDEQKNLAERIDVLKEKNKELLEEYNKLSGKKSSTVAPKRPQLTKVLTSESMNSLETRVDAKLSDAHGGDTPKPNQDPENPARVVSQ